MRMPDDDSLPEVCKAWWVKHGYCKRPQEVLLLTFGRHLLGVISETIKGNKPTKQYPSTFEQLAKGIKRARENIYRWGQGATEPDSSVIFLALATVLELPLAALFPEKATWIKDATRDLVGKSFSPGEVTCFVEYTLRCAGGTSSKPSDPLDDETTTLWRATFEKIKQFIDTLVTKP